MNDKKVKIIVADDHPLFRAGVRQTLETNENFSIVGEAENGSEALELIIQLKPDISILDLRMPDKSGLDILQNLDELNINAKVIILTMFKNSNYFYQAVSLGVKGYVLKETAADELIKAVEKVDAGGTFISSVISQYITKSAKPDWENKLIAESILALTETEKKVLKLIGEWKTNCEIGELLSTSPRTAGNHRTNISQKLDLHGKNSLIRFAIENQELF